MREARQVPQDCTDGRRDRIGRIPSPTVEEQGDKLARCRGAQIIEPIVHDDGPGGVHGDGVPDAAPIFGRRLTGVEPFSCEHVVKFGKQSGAMEGTPRVRLRRIRRDVNSENGSTPARRSEEHTSELQSR